MDEFVWFIVAMVTIYSAAGSYQQIAFEVNTRLLDEHKLGLFNTSKHISCARMCKFFTACKSIAFYLENSTCILYDVDSSSPNIQFENTPGSVYSEISSWSQNIAGGCGQHECQYFERCLPIGSSYVCRELDCGKPPRLKFGYINVTSTTYGSEANVGCNIGYTLHGPSTIKCYANSQWSNIPWCYPVECGKLTIENAANYEPYAKYGVAIEVECYPGYELSGSSIVVCQANGNWSETGCIPIDCGWPTILNGIYNTSTTVYDSIVDVYCDVGYDLVGARTVMCQADATWSALPECMLIDCGYPMVGNSTFHTTSNETNTTYNSTLKVVCDETLVLVGESDIVCQSNGAWSTLPKCVAVVCFDACFMFYPGITLTHHSYCNTQFASGIYGEQDCIVFCNAQMSLFASLNYNSNYQFCRCLGCTLDEYEAGGNAYAPNTDYDLYVRLP